MVDINLSQLRTWEGSQKKAFEKLCTQLSMCEPEECDTLRTLPANRPCPLHCAQGLSECATIGSSSRAKAEES